MYSVVQIHITNRDSQAYQYCQEKSVLAWHLYNAALYRIRQCFTGYEKTTRTQNESEVFDEIDRLKTEYPSICVKKVISYKHLEKLMRVTQNPDFFAGLPMQTSQAVVKQAVNDFKNWLKAMAAYKRNPRAFLGMPRMPHYKNSPSSFTITNQDAVLYGKELKLPKIKGKIAVGNLPEGGRLKEVKIIPYYGRFILCLTLELDKSIIPSKGSNTAGIDFGTDNFAAIVSTDGSSRLYKGGAVLSENQWFAKERARAVSILTAGHKNRTAHSRYLDTISYHHTNFTKDQMHKISRDIVSFCVNHEVSTLVLGDNRLWKQESHIGDGNNQKFVQMPIYQLRKMIEYKAANVGITVIHQEESYTSKASFLDGDDIPVYGVDDAEVSFSGKRIERGLYRTSSGQMINADINGAANIIRKAIPNAWEEWYATSPDVRFLSNPDVLGFHELNPKGIPVKRIVAE